MVASHLDFSHNYKFVCPHSNNPDYGAARDYLDR